MTTTTTADVHPELLLPRTAVKQEKRRYWCSLESQCALTSAQGRAHCRRAAPRKSSLERLCTPVPASDASVSARPSCRACPRTTGRVEEEEEEEEDDDEDEDEEKEETEKDEDDEDDEAEPSGRAV